MNKRIEELIKQCTWTACWPGDPEAGDFDKERFAQLLIEGCADLANKAENDELWTRPVGDIIKEHFGLK